MFKYPNQFFVTGKLSDHDFLLLNQTLKTRPCETFLLRHSLAKVNSLPLKIHPHCIKRYNNCIPLERLDTQRHAYQKIFAGKKIEMIFQRNLLRKLSYVLYVEVK